ncbi:MAG: ubiquitinyl hydrolase 1 [Chaenotheca gracillima]|nr:MAG: ubiquitinyl hydrolase 1 [Chaenotheca gracillima]
MSASDSLAQAGKKGQPAVCPTDQDAITPKAKQGQKRSQKQTLNYVLRSGLAGGLAGCAAKTIVGPLDRVKILFQASNPQFAKYTGSWFGVVTAMKDIYRQDGTKGLFRGHSATLLRIFPYAAIKFLAYEQIRAIVITKKEQETPLRRLLSGSLAGITSVFFTYPLEVIRVRLAFETKRDSRSTLSTICRQIYNEQPALAPSASSAAATAPPLSSTLAHPTPSNVSASATAAAQKITPRSGLGNFYRGFSPTLWGMLPYAGMSFLTHDTAGDWLRDPSIAKYTTVGPSTIPDKPAPLKYWAELISGGFAGLVSQTASYPLEVIRRRMQVGGAVGDGRRLGMAETASIIFRERGFKGFFIGLGIGYFKVVPMVATSFFVYERSKLYLGI